MGRYEITADDDGTERWQPLDRFGAPAGPAIERHDTRIAADGTLCLRGHAAPLLLRRGRAFTCWMAIPKSGAKSDHWLFLRNLHIHDQGGRARAGGGDTGAAGATIRLRNVVWPDPTTNRPSLVLYAFTADDAEHAAGYGWADPGAIRIGLHLRWMQASCTKDPA